MANHYTKARTNYFVVRDVAALKEDLKAYVLLTTGWSENLYGGELILDENPNNVPAGAIALFCDGGWPNLDEDSVLDRLGDDDDDEDAASSAPLPHEDIYTLVASHLVDDEVAVFQEVGFEKMRYLAGTSVAVNAKGESQVIQLDDIYDIARKQLGAGSSGQITTATY